MRWHEIFEVKWNKIRTSHQDAQQLPYDDGIDGERKHYLDKAHAEAPWRGPHEGREVQLMLSGKKPAALVSDSEWDRYMPYVESGQFVMQKIGDGSAFFARSDQSYRIPKLMKHLAYFKQHELDDDFNYEKWEAQYGILLGFSNDDIRRFISK